MKKILVTDLMGTLIPLESDSINYLYGGSIYANKSQEIKNFNRAFSALSVPLNQFLSDGNEINIVTSIDGHMLPRDFLEDYVMFLLSKIHSNSSQLHIYFQAKNLEKTIKDLNGYADFSEINGEVIASMPNNVKVVLLKEKEDVFNHIRYMGSLLYAIGDTHKDLKMLMQSLALGGQADFINYRLYQSYEQLKNILTATLSREDSIMVEQIAIERYPNYFNLSKSERAFILEQLERELITDEHVYKKRIEMFNKAFAGEVDINNLYIENCVYQIIDMYNQLSGLSFTYQDIIPKSICHSIGMYPTFTDYYNRVLKKR